ncbi:Retrotransposon-derived protein PEG10 [Anabarilius grahami]|uniref:Retrotransposon-derived protein PEG10 n=1 Tax=Anabarilius grahami TaxID=495550 RepID=A0A3N0Z9K7_ANAGA|nr:Retrotransposon-derived protein PEG10 [Anabarilius grahami]
MPVPWPNQRPFSGSAEDCNGFILQCSLVLEMQPHLYPNDHAKVAFIISQLNGKALRWAETLWSQSNPITQSLSSFISHFKEVFGKPAWDSSISEQLYHLKQGSMTVNEYALQFRTLAATSGWNEQSLITTYRQGLDPRVWLHLAAYEDSIGLERFIQLSIRFSTRMQSCLEEHQGQPLFTSSLRRPESVSPPEPANEPMQLENTRLSPTERQRRLTQNLCLYCGLPGHLISECPVRPSRPMLVPSSTLGQPATSSLAPSAQAQDDRNAIHLPGPLDNWKTPQSKTKVQHLVAEVVQHLVAEVVQHLVAEVDQHLVAEVDQHLVAEVQHLVAEVQHLVAEVDQHLVAEVQHLVAEVDHHDVEVLGPQDVTDLAGSTITQSQRTPSPEY